MPCEAVDKVRQRLASAGRSPAGNCYEAALAVGIMLASPERIVRLVRGTVRGIPHWWVCDDGQIVDPTSDQFNPPAATEEYERSNYERVDLESLAWLLTD